MIVSEYLKILKEEARTQGGTSIEVKGSCMKPFFQEGDILSIYASRLILPGDIIALYHDDKIVRVHRFLGYKYQKGWKLLAKADDHPKVDAWSDYSNYIGQVYAVSRTDSTEGELLIPLKTRLHSLYVFLKYIFKRSLNLLLLLFKGK
jgi:hypothetical protein